jgi:predicted transcriptional regulator
MHEFFDRVMRIHGITGKCLADRTGMSTTHISDFRRGKTNPPCDTFQRLLDAVDEISPGAKRDFCLLLSGATISPLTESSTSPRKVAIAEMSSLELAQLLMAVADKLQEDKSAKQLVSA